MRSSTLAAVAVALLSASVTAFPAALFEDDGARLTEFLVKLAEEKPKRDLLSARQTSNPGFNATAQRVETTGAHAFIAPGPTDERGECPGLNALANHGYLPRNGRATSQQFIDATFAGFGMSKDLGGFLAYFGSFVDGDGSSWSIGGVPRTGIGGSHNNYETDSSPLKSDLNQYGSLGKLVMSQFYDLYNRQPDAATANYNLAILRDFRHTRFQESIAKNPYYTYLPFSGILVSQAAFTFIYRFMGNKSAAAPAGILDKATLKSFMSITGPENNLTWTFGNERFPDVFYKRAIGDEYSVPYFFSDIGYFAQKYPEILSVGCNTGTVNSYTTFTPQQLTGGALTPAKVAANPLCYGLQMTNAANIVGTTNGASSVTGLNTLIVKGLASLGLSCSLVTAPDFSAPRAACPGFTGFYGGPTGPVAPGAIQS